MVKEPLPTLKEIRTHGTKSFPCAVYQTRSVGKGAFVKHHWHDEVEILYFFGGNFQLEINMEVYEIQSECFYFVNPGELHSISSKTSGNCGEEAVVFHMNILNFDNYDATQTELIQPVTNGKIVFPRCIFPDHPAFEGIRTAFYEIMQAVNCSPSTEFPFTEEAVTDDLTSQLLIKSSLLRIFAYLSSGSLFSPVEKNYDKRVESLKTALTYIRENYQDKIYVRDLACQIGMNEQYFCRFFKNAIGKSPMEYVNEYRIKQAVRCLKDTNAMVTDICLECGFNNFGNFLREFRKITGTTPMKYRKSMRETPETPENRRSAGKSMSHA